MVTFGSRVGWVGRDFAMIWFAIQVAPPLETHFPPLVVQTVSLALCSSRTAHPTDGCIRLGVSRYELGILFVLQSPSKRWHMSSYELGILFKS